jgi:hypothetical protein
MPLSKYDRYFGGKKGGATKAHAAMLEQYGSKKGEQVFYALKNKRAGSRRRARHAPVREGDSAAVMAKTRIPKNLSVAELNKLQPGHGTTAQKQDPAAAREPRHPASARRPVPQPRPAADPQDGRVQPHPRRPRVDGHEQGPRQPKGRRRRAEVRGRGGAGGPGHRVPSGRGRADRRVLRQLPRRAARPRSQPGADQRAVAGGDAGPRRQRPGPRPGRRRRGVAGQPEPPGRDRCGAGER